MDRVDLRNGWLAPIRKQVAEDWSALSRIFPRPNELPVPGIVLLHFDIVHDPSLKTPTISSTPGIETKAKYYTLSATHGNNFRRGGYIHKGHVIVLNGYATADTYGANSALLEEVTHAATFIQGKSLAHVDDLNGVLNDSNPGFGNRLSQGIVKYLGKPNPPIEVNEFFPPLGEAFLLGLNYQSDSARTIEYIEALLLALEKSPGNINHKNALIDCVVHLPRLAGDFLLRQYQRDVRAIMRAHPTLTDMSSKQLWAEYCLPLLEKGRL